MNDPLKRAAGTKKQPKPQEELLPLDSELRRKYIPYVVGFVLVLIYAYWPTLVWIEDAWRNEPDYSHGYLVPVLGLLLVWNRADSFPGARATVSWSGLSLILIAVVMRVGSRLVYADFLDAWSMLPLIAGVVWVVLGRRAMLWSLPAICFLFFMIPMPYRAESLLSWKLQGIATEVSTIFLRVLGQPAVAEGHMIWTSAEAPLQVEEACSGLRIFVGVAALAYFWAAMVKRHWIDRVVLAALVLPLAVFANSVRITIVGLLYLRYTDLESQKTIHDYSGYLMIPLAFVLLWIAKTFWERLYRPVEQLTAKDFVRSSSQPSAS